MAADETAKKKDKSEKKVSFVVEVKEETKPPTGTMFGNLTVIEKDLYDFSDDEGYTDEEESDIDTDEEYGLTSDDAKSDPDEDNNNNNNNNNNNDKKNMNSKGKNSLKQKNMHANDKSNDNSNDKNDKNKGNKTSNDNNFDNIQTRPYSQSVKRPKKRNNNHPRTSSVGLSAQEKKRRQSARISHLLNAQQLTVELMS